MAFLFLDTETTGLDPDLDRVLEIAWAITDDKFTVETFDHHLVEQENWGHTNYRLRNNPVVRKMHTESGLWADLMSSLDQTKFMDAEVYVALMADVTEVTDRGEDVHLAGFSVHFDKSFLVTNGFAGWFEGESPRIHHRMLDLSAVKMMLEASGVPYEKARNDNPHRASYDVTESIEQAKIFRNLLQDMHEDHMLVQSKVLS